MHAYVTYPINVFVNRLNLPRLTQIKTVVFLKSLALIFPNEISTHEWFSHETQTFTFGEEDE